MPWPEATPRSLWKPDDAYRKIDGQWFIDRTRIDFLWPRREVQAIRESVL